jgi:hypothetical protein
MKPRSRSAAHTTKLDEQTQERNEPIAHSPI